MRRIKVALVGLMLAGIICGCVSGEAKTVAVKDSVKADTTLTDTVKVDTTVTK